MPAVLYDARFSVGSVVRVQDSDVLSTFSRPQWRYHHPVEQAQLSFAGRTGAVESIGYYHGGDVLYTLAGFPGVWHEAALLLVVEDNV
jgi:hypothetical protein